MYRRRMRCDDFECIVSPSMFVTSLSPGPDSSGKKTKTPKSKTPSTSTVHRPKVRQSNAVKTPDSRKKTDETSEINSEDPIADLDNEQGTGENTRPGRARKKSVKMRNPDAKTEVDSPKRKSKPLKTTKISDYFKVTPEPEEPEPVPIEEPITGMKQEPKERGTSDLPGIPGVEWKVGAKCEAMDKDWNWYRSKVVEVSEKLKMIKIHFEGWKPKFDAWYTMDTDMIRPASEEWAQLDSAQMKGKSWKKRIEETPVKVKEELKSPAKTPVKTPAKTHEESPVKSAPKSPVKSPKPKKKSKSENGQQKAALETSDDPVRVEEPEEERDPETPYGHEKYQVFLNELKFEVGARVEAQDKTNHWYRGRIIMVSEIQRVVKVHYDGWKSRWDCWYPMESERLRPLTKDWVDPKLLPKKKPKKKSLEPKVKPVVEEQNEELSLEPAVEEPVSDDRVETAEEASPVKEKSDRKRKRKSSEEHREPLTTKIKLGETPEIVEKPKKRRKTNDSEERDFIEYLPEAAAPPLVILEEVPEPNVGIKKEIPDEISYESLLNESKPSPKKKSRSPEKKSRSLEKKSRSPEKKSRSPEKKSPVKDSRKRSKRKRKATSTDEWATEEMLDRVISGREEGEEEEEEEEEPVANRSRLSESESESLKPKKGRPKKQKETDPVPEDTTHPEPEEIPQPIPESLRESVSEERSKKIKKPRQSMDSFSDPDPFDDSPPSDVDDEEEYVPGFRQPSKSSRKKHDKRALQKGAEWKKVGDDEFMDIPPPEPYTNTINIAVPKKKKVKKEKKKKIIPEYTDAYNKAMRAMSIAEEKEKRRLQRKLEKLKQKEIEEKTLKKKRRGGPSAYQLFCNYNRPRLMAQNPGASFALINKKLGETWHNIGEREKATWRRKSKKLKDKGAVAPKASMYAKQMKEISSLLKPGQRSAQAVEAQLGEMSSAGNVSPYRVSGTDPWDAAAHLKLLGESLSIIGQRLTEHKGEFAVQGTVSVMLDSFLCSLGPLMCLTTQVPELDALPQKTLASTLDSIAYFMPGL